MVRDSAAPWRRAVTSFCNIYLDYHECGTARVRHGGRGALTGIDIRFGGGGEGMIGDGRPSRRVGPADWGWTKRWERLEAAEAALRTFCEYRRL